ncbi:hypothetical protein NEUTE2DRAFT_130376 [Neurospora tetrasperma FGSC 2509]|nr:hypothetical protein NEUTE2DRAFT_130376 [Neurospora tetrasperma FGSC 2509]
MEDHALCPECVRAARKNTKEEPGGGSQRFWQKEEAEASSIILWEGMNGWMTRSRHTSKVAHASIIAGHVPKGPSISRKWEVSEMEGSRALWLWWVEGGVAQAGHKWDQKEGEVDTDPPGKRNRVDTQFWKARKVWMKCHGSKNP